MEGDERAIAGSRVRIADVGTKEKRRLIEGLSAAFEVLAEAGSKQAGRVDVGAWCDEAGRDLVMPTLARPLA